MAETDSVDQDRAYLRKLKEELWPKAYFDQDDALLAEILADEFQMVDADGNWSNKERELEHVRNNAPVYDSLTFEIKRLDVFAGHTAVVAGEGVIRGSNEEGPYEFQYQSSNMLIKRNERWQAVASHVSGFMPRDED